VLEVPSATLNSMPRDATHPSSHTLCKAPTRAHPQDDCNTVSLHLLFLLFAEVFLPGCSHSSEYCKKVTFLANESGTMCV
jgi:hypothetical protein